MARRVGQPLSSQQVLEPLCRRSRHKWTRRRRSHASEAHQVERARGKGEDAGSNPARGSGAGDLSVLPCTLDMHADVTQLVACHLPKVNVAGSNPVIRSEV